MQTVERAGATARHEPLTATAKVLLGMIALGRTTGYEIKQLVDRSTRFFWAASYGQIYPELRRLERVGLVRGHEEPTGGRPRTVYELTAAGRHVLEQWLDSGEEPVAELREEGMLKLFFSDLAGPERRLGIVRQIRKAYERKHARLREIEAGITSEASGPALTLQYGLGITAWMIEWCRITERRLSGQEAAE